jgi:lipopolysaccharide/colanic/teichoic acid biosynthesis glycosyltransferase
MQDRVEIAGSLETIRGAKFSRRPLNIGTVAAFMPGGFSIPARPGAPRISRPAPRRSFYSALGKRALDLTIVLLAVPVALPIVLLCALMLRIEGGSPFYRQARIGRNGKLFPMLKLRTMVPDSDARLARLLDGDPALRAEWDTTQKLRNDPRVTRLGALLRQTSLDELPQLWNVLTGEMSLVGPRPMMPEQLALYGDARDYNALRPGITGIWQVSTRNDSSFAHRATIDADYRRAMSLGTDLGLLFKTVGVVLRRTGC